MVCCGVLLQVGDILDRGDQELKLLYMLERLQRQAAAAGGALWVLNGNHETMNVGGNFRYATQGVCAAGWWAPRRDDEPATQLCWGDRPSRLRSPAELHAGSGRRCCV